MRLNFRWILVVMVCAASSSSLNLSAAERGPVPPNPSYSIQNSSTVLTAAETSSSNDISSAVNIPTANCGPACSPCLESCCAECDHGGCCNSDLQLFTAYDSFKSFPDFNFSNNNGLRSGLNYGHQLGSSDWGMQIGGSYGVYDFHGRLFLEPEDVQNQLFFTAGFFRKANANNPWNLGVVYDWMVNDNYGVASDEPFLGQVRLHAGFCLNAVNEVGIWAAIRDHGDSQAGFDYRSLSHANLFWHHKFAESNADLTAWMGFFENDRLAADGSLYSTSFGLLGTVPLNDRLAFYAEAEYMNPSDSSKGEFAVIEEGSNVSVGLIYYPRCNSRSRTVAGNCWAPLMPVANNGTMIVDFGPQQ